MIVAFSLSSSQSYPVPARSFSSRYTYPASLNAPSPSGHWTYEGHINNNKYNKKKNNFFFHCFKLQCWYILCKNKNKGQGQKLQIKMTRWEEKVYSYGQISYEKTFVIWFIKHSINQFLNGCLYIHWVDSIFRMTNDIQNKYLEI